jgi:hypothetical protein
MLSQEQSELVQLIQELEPEQVHRVLEFTRKIKDGLPIDYSDHWTEEDLRDAGNELLQRLDEIDPYDWPDSERQGDESSPYRRIRRIEDSEEKSVPPSHPEGGR